MFIISRMLLFTFCVYLLLFTFCHYLLRVFLLGSFTPSIDKRIIIVYLLNTTLFIVIVYIKVLDFVVIFMIVTSPSCRSFLKMQFIILLIEFAIQTYLNYLCYYLETLFGS